MESLDRFLSRSFPLSLSRPLSSFLLVGMSLSLFLCLSLALSPCLSFTLSQGETALSFSPLCPLLVRSLRGGEGDGDESCL